MQYEWDQNKSLLNQQKHGLSFELAVMVFECPHITIQDHRHEYGGIRYLTMGTLGFFGRVVIVAHTKRLDKIRIISIRKANKREQLIFEKLKQVINEQT